MDDLLRTLRFACRSLLREKTVSLLAVVCMALGIGTCVTLFTALNPWLYRPLPYPAASRLVSLRETLPEGGGVSTKPGQLHFALDALWESCLKCIATAQAVPRSVPRGKARAALLTTGPSGEGGWDGQPALDPVPSGRASGC